MASKARLKVLAAQAPNRATKKRGRWCSEWGLRSSLQSAGDSVSELNIEMMVEAAMVSANCR